MALTKFQVKEGYAFFHLDKNGTRLKSTPTGGVVELLDQNQFEQSWKLEAVEKDAPVAPNDMELLVGYRGNKNLGDLFHESKIKTFVQVLNLDSKELDACFKGNKEQRASQSKALLESAYSLAGIG